MATTLFSGNQEETLFYTLLAARKRNDKIKEVEAYEQEIQVALDKCGEIFVASGSNCNFIAEIEARENAPINKETFLTMQSKDINRIEIETLTGQLSEFLKTISREVREDLEFYSKQIIDRKTRRDEELKNIQQLLSGYPGVERFDIKEAMTSLGAIFDFIGTITNIVVEEPEIIPLDTVIQQVIIEEEPELVINEEPKIPNHFQLVTGIKVAPDALIGFMTPTAALDVKEEVDNNEVLAKKPSDFIEVADETLNEIAISPVLEEEKEPVLEVVEEVKEEPLVEEPVQTEELAQTVDYTMIEGLSLAALAEALCGNPMGYTDIYAVNKELFDKTVNEKNNSNFEDIEHNDQIFAGLSIKVPAEFKLQPLIFEEKEIALAA